MQMPFEHPCFAFIRLSGREVGDGQELLAFEVRAAMNAAPFIVDEPHGGTGTTAQSGWPGASALIAPHCRIHPLPRRQVELSLALRASISAADLMDHGQGQRSGQEGRIPEALQRSAGRTVKAVAQDLQVVDLMVALSGIEPGSAAFSCFL